MRVLDQESRDTESSASDATARVDFKTIIDRSG